MSTTPAREDQPLPELSLAQLKPFFSITILECVVEDVDRAYITLITSLKKVAQTAGQSLSVELTGEVSIGKPGDNDSDHSFAALVELGFDRLYGITRRRSHIAPWASRDSAIVDTTNELTIVLRRGRLVAIRSDIINPTALLRWADRPTTPYKPLLPEILHGTFAGDGKMLWLQGVHRQRSSKPNSKAVGGTRLQDAYDAAEDASFAVTSMRVDYVPERPDALLRGQLTVSADKSHLSSKAMQSFPTFMAATEEALSMIEKSIAAEAPPDPAFPGYAVRENNLDNVFGAYDIRVASPEELYADPRYDEGDDQRAQLLRESLHDVTGESSSSAATVEIGEGGASSGLLTLRPVPVRGGFELSVGFTRPPSDEKRTREVRDAIGEGDLISIYYESGHTYSGRQIARQNLTAPPFSNIEFLDFTGCNIQREKPNGHGWQQIHDRINKAGDTSIFSWIVNKYKKGWLICDDGPGEVADFLHLDNEGTLTAIHVKAAHSSSLSRRIAVTSFEELVSQAEKNIQRLDPDTLPTELLKQRVTSSACWRDGDRVDSRTDFLNHLATRLRTDKTFVLLVQPHLLEPTHGRARRALEDGNPTSDSHSLVLLDNLLYSTRRTVTSYWDDLTIWGCS